MTSMKVFVALFLLVSVLSVPACHAEHHPPAPRVAVSVDYETYSFEDYIVDFDKSYSTAEEYQKRRSIFEENLQIIRSHNSNKNNNNHGHVLGVNAFADIRSEELPRGYTKMLSSRYASVSTAASLRRLAENHDERLLSQLPTTMELVESLPQAVDWRLRGVTTPVKSQGQCGSCWAFASTAVLESHIAIQTGTLFSLSEQELVSCVGNPRHCGGGGGCTGSTAELAFQHVMEYGVVQEWDFGYQSYHGESVACELKPVETTKTATIRGGGNVRNSTKYKGAVASIQTYSTLPSNNYTVLMNVVAKLGPVAVSVACMPWHLYRGGVFFAPLNNSQATDVDHLVVLEGYGTDETTGEDFWLVRNSWGPLWGEHGYVRLLRVDPSTLDDPDGDCGMDLTPANGVSCTKDESGNDIIPPAAKICGNSGILYDTSIPLGGHLM